MKYMRPEPNPSGAYSPPQSAFASTLVAISDELAAELVEHNGFVIPVIEDGVVVSQTINTEAWEAWKAEMAEQAALAESVVPEPTAEEQLRADVDYIAAMTGIVL